MTVEQLAALLKELGMHTTTIYPPSGGMGRRVGYRDLAELLLPRLGALPQKCAYCGDGPCPHPDVEGPLGSCRRMDAVRLAEWAWNKGRSFAADTDGAVPESVKFWHEVPTVLKDEVFIPAAQRFLASLRTVSALSPEPSAAAIEAAIAHERLRQV